MFLAFFVVLNAENNGNRKKIVDNGALHFLSDKEENKKITLLPGESLGPKVELVHLISCSVQFIYAMVRFVVMVRVSVVRQKSEGKMNIGQKT